MLLIPFSLGNLLLQLDVFHASILLSNTLPVLVNLRSSCIEGGPFFIRLESGLVGMGWDIYTERALSVKDFHRPTLSIELHVYFTYRRRTPDIGSRTMFLQYLRSSHKCKAQGSESSE
jgi:hypothetical protein